MKYVLRWWIRGEDYKGHSLGKKEFTSMASAKRYKEKLKKKDDRIGVSITYPTKKKRKWWRVW